MPKIYNIYRRSKSWDQCYVHKTNLVLKSTNHATKKLNLLLSHSQELCFVRHQFVRCMCFSNAWNVAKSIWSYESWVTKVQMISSMKCDNDRMTDENSSAAHKSSIEPHHHSLNPISCKSPRGHICKIRK